MPPEGRGPRGGESSWSSSFCERSARLRSARVPPTSASLPPNRSPPLTMTRSSTARRALLLVQCSILTVLVATPAEGQRPRQDVVDVPATREGLCVSNLFQSNMVLQREKPIRIWGFAAPSEEITVSFAGRTGSARAGEDRRWLAELPALPASSTPQSLTIASAQETLRLENVLVGDVWVLGGQSNMEFELAKVENGALEIVSANLPNLRILTVPYGQGPAKQIGFPRLHEWSDWFGRHFRKGDWDVCTPEIARDLSAIGYVFARRLHLASQVPIGVIDASRGGTTVETWTPESVLRGMQSAAVRAKLADWDHRVSEWDPRADLEKRIEENQRWVERQRAEGKPVPADRETPPSDLRPGPIADPNYPGSCYAAMLGPLEGLAVKGVIFHQGYNNALDGMRGVALYRDVFPAMIRAWRDAFGDPRLPFGILSLCTEGNPQTRDDYVEQMLNTGIYIRAAHYRTFLDLLEAGDANIGYASTYDLRRRWYHPQLKIPAGERIARWALATQYGFARQLEWMPPRLLGVERREGALLLKMDTEVGDPEDGAIEGFAIAGEDRRFQPADVAYLEVGKDERGQPRLDRKCLLLSSPLVAAPVHFRFAWGRNPLANLQASGNKDLPFATQRSDDWDPSEVPLGVLEEKVEGQLTRAQMNRIREVLKSEDERRRLFEARRLLEQLGERAQSSGGR
jgi:sialate O-acetylesterase